MSVRAPWSRRAILALVLLGCALSASGCWSRRELEDTAFVLAAGIAPAPGRRVRLTVQTALPSQLSGGGKGEGGGGGGAGSGQTGPVWVASAEGPTVFAALRNLEKRASDRVYLAHARAVILDERVAQEGITPFLDYAEREPQIRETIALLVTPDSPEEVLKTVPPQEKIPVFYLNNLLEHARLHGAALPLDLHAYRVHTSLPGAAVAVPRLRLHKPQGAKAGSGTTPENLSLDGLAIFRQDRLVGYLPARLVPGVLWLHSKATGLPVAFRDPRYPETMLSAEIAYARCRRRVIPDPERPEQTLIRIEVEGEANLREVASYGRNGRQESGYRALNRALSQEVAHAIWRSLTAARQYKADVFELAEEAREVLTAKEWRRFAPSWPETFARCRVDVRVDLRLRRRGMIL
ncbi:MAG TPA: Ger(x)C family spore germination protein [Firmicutes bacterium]|nr:Ger(x)C family spore germination protein [Bacillota bacterium]